MKQPNGYGSVHKMQGKRRKPWRVRKTNGWAMDSKGEKLVQQYITIGYFETRQEALQALADYNQDPMMLKAILLLFQRYMTNGLLNTLKKYVPRQFELGNRHIITVNRFGISE